MLWLTSSSSPSLLPRPSPDPGIIAGGGGGAGKRLPVVPSFPFLLRWSWPRKAKSKSSISVTALGNKTAETTGYGSDHLPIYDLEPKLAEFKDHFNYTMKRYLEQKHLIEKHEGSLEEFSKGYLKFGINTEHGASVYREWAPAAEEAQLVGDFNNWNGSEHKMTKDNFGVWSIRISHVNGKPAIPHNSKVKFRFRHDGVWVERIPAWIRYATVSTSKSGATYDGLHWDPPTSERYVFKYPRPPKPDVPRIYEAHVGVSGEKLEVGTYREFADNVLPRLRATNYNTIQLMAIMEHSDCASFGYYVTNFFAVSSRSGTPEDLKYLIDKAHSFGLCVLMDVIHSHASNNVIDGLNGYEVGQNAQESYFYTGEKGHNKMWNGRMLNYANWEVLRFLLSNLRYWMDEFMFDGFRFVGVTSMLYNHNGINMSFTGTYKEYFGLDTNVDAVVYMMFANQLIHKLLPEAIVVAVDASGMPVLCWPVDEGGLGFDYRQAMTIPDRWIDYLENKGDQQWSMSSVTSQTLTNRKYPEKFIAYTERQNHPIICDKAMAFLLMEWETYSVISGMEPDSPTIDRGIALQKMIHFITMAFGGDSYLKFMGNEYMNAFDQAMNMLDDKCSFLSSLKQTASDMNKEEKAKSKSSVPVSAPRDFNMATAQDGVNDLPIYDLDPKFAGFKDHFSYRMKKYLEQKHLIEKHEGGLEEFSKGYLKFGINTENDATVYREWAPAAKEAQLIGDFNNWNGSGHRMTKDNFGVWSIRISHVNGKPAIPHNSKVKFRFHRGDGIWVDRIPAWIRYATADACKFGAPYDGVHWDPPTSERYVFKHPRPQKPDAPRIYEAHVGMSGEKPEVSTYREFADNVLPRVKANNYNTIQLMAIMEHSYYASFGYHVTNFFAVSSRSGTPEDLKYLVDKAHSLGLRVLMDVVHSHASSNMTDGLNGYDVGQNTQESYFHTGERGYHKLWDSRLFNYANWEVLRFLLSNLRYWMDEFMFDGFRFDGVTSMLYNHHGINTSFSGNYKEYFGLDTDVDAVVYMMLANHLMHKILPEATVVAEDVSGMPVLCRSVDEGGVGFDYRLAMAIPDRWIDYLKNKDDLEWSMSGIAHTLTNRRYTEKCIAYAESHDQSIVGDKTMAFLLMDKEMYAGMSDLQPASPTIDRGIALQKMIHFITMALGGDGYLNFMGNEFGHPEWIDFPREGNNWSYDKCRRQWSLVDIDHLRYKYMNAFDQAMNALDDKFSFLSSSKQIVSDMNEEKKIIVFERGDLVFVFNFHPSKTYDGYKVGCDLPGKYKVALDSDALMFGGHGRVAHDSDHFTSPEGIPGVPETNFNNRPNSFKILSPPRTCVAYYRVEEKAEKPKDEGAAFWGENAPGYIDVEATGVKDVTDGEATSGSEKASTGDDSVKRGINFVFRSPDKDNK